MKHDYSKIIAKESPWHDQAYDFLLDWLKEISLSSRRPKKAKRGMPYTRTLKRWGKMYGEDDLADIALRARKIMDEIRKNRPEIGKFL